jgi:hypothetical protein
MSFERLFLGRSLSSVARFCFAIHVMLNRKIVDVKQAACLEPLLKGKTMLPWPIPMAVF